MRVNHYQRVGTFVVRLAGGIVCLIGSLGLLYALSVKAGAVVASPGYPPAAAVSAVWLAGGGILLVSAGRVGRWWGRGLD